MGSQSWTPNRVNEIIRNEKYIKRTLMGKEPYREKVVNEDGSIAYETKLVKEFWTPLISEEVWWLAQSIRLKKSGKIILYGDSNPIRTNRNTSNDVISNKSFCSYGYTRTRQTLHMTSDGKYILHRYVCRQQENEKIWGRQVGSKCYSCACQVPAVSEAKLWLMSLKVFQYLFGNHKDDIMQMLKYLEDFEKSQQIKAADGDTLEKALANAQQSHARLDRKLFDELIGYVRGAYYLL